MLAPFCSLWSVLLAALVGWVACGVAVHRLGLGRLVGAAPPAALTFRRVYASAAGVLCGFLLLLWAMGYGPGGPVCKRLVTSVAEPREEILPARGPAAAAQTSPLKGLPAPAAGLPAPPPTAKVYFGHAKAVLPESAPTTLGTTQAFLRAHPNARAALAGFHDGTGDPAKNDALAQNRARAVREWFVAGGIARERLVLRQPAAANGAPEEARRVEVAVLAN